MGMGKAEDGSATVFPGWLKKTKSGGTATEKQLRSKRTRGSNTVSNRE